MQVAVGECRHGQQGRRRQRCRAHHASPPSACGLNLRRVGLLVPKARALGSFARQGAPWISPLASLDPVIRWTVALGDRVQL